MMKNAIKIEAPILRVGDVVINRNAICEANIGKGTVLMQSGHEYTFNPKVLELFFDDLVDFKGVIL